MIVKCKNTDGNGNVAYVDYEVPELTEETVYTEEQLSTMTVTELREICTSLGISTSMNKVNMIRLILNGKEDGA